MKLISLLRLARPYRGVLTVCLALMLAETAVALVIPWLGGQFGAGLILGAEGEGVALGRVALLIVGFIALQSGLRILRGIVVARTGERVLADFRGQLYDHMQALPMRFFHERRQGDILTFSVYELSYLGHFITGTMIQFVPHVLAVIGAILLLMTIDAALAAVVAIIVPAFFVLTRLLSRKLRPLAAKKRDAYAELYSLISENTAMMAAIKAYTREGVESARNAETSEKLRALNAEYAQIQAIVGPATQLVTAVVVVAVLWWASSRVGAGTMSPAEVVSFFLYAAFLTRPFSALAQAWGETQHALGSLGRLEGFLTHPVEDHVAGRDPGPVAGAIRFEDVRYAYPGRETALDGITLEIGAGETLAITGHNGAGKSTLIHLLLRFDEPASGRILLDGADIAGLNLTALRRAIGVVPQSPMLLNASVMANIAFARPDATPAEIEAAARHAQAHDFIAALPEGYETGIGDAGVRLSGGQRQRIALARALLKDPDILVLDEPTAMFDPEGERAFVADARRAFADRTVILVTHRPASLALADRVIRLDAGRLVPFTGTGEAEAQALDRPAGHPADRTRQ